MQKENDFIKYDLDFLEKVFSYLNNYEKLEIAVDDTFKFSKQEKHNLQRIKELYEKIILLRDYQIYELNSISKEEALSKANSFLVEIFPKKEKEILELDNLVTFDNINIYESGLIYILNNNRISFNQILIPDHTSNYTSSIIVHEKMHALTFQNMDLECLFRNGLELLPIFLQRMMLFDFCDEYANILDRIIRINDTKQSFFHLDYAKYLRNKPNKTTLDEYVCDYYNISANDYLIGDLYSSLLMEYYLLDKNEMIRKLNQVLNQKLSITDFLTSYEVSLSNKKLFPVIKQNINKCKRISIIP